MQLYQNIPKCHLKKCPIAQVKNFQENARCVVLSTLAPSCLPGYKNQSAQMEDKGRKMRKCLTLPG